MNSRKKVLFSIWPIKCCFLV